MHDWIALSPTDEELQVLDYARFVENPTINHVGQDELTLLRAGSAVLSYVVSTHHERRLFAECGRARSALSTLWEREVAKYRTVFVAVVLVFTLPYEVAAAVAAVVDVDVDQPALECDDAARGTFDPVAFALA